MSSTGYKLIGMAVWKTRAVAWDATKLYVRHRYGVQIPRRRTVVLVVAGTTVVAGAVAIGVQRDRG
jgi:hypothetical protein